MASLFISHSSRDRTLTDRVRERLRSAGFSHFLDHDAERGIRGGRKWEEVLHRELDVCDAVVAVVTEHSIDSRWCFAELAMTRARGKPVFPVRFSPDLVHPLLKDTQHLELESLPSDLEAAGLGARGSFDWDPSRSPYPGLEHFEAGYAGVFFGRDREIKRVRERLEGAGQSRFVGVVGPSGSGKSSLVRAGVLPQLASSPVWRRLRPMTPGTRPVSALARALADAFVRSGRDRRASEIESSLATEPRALAETAHDLLSGSDEARVLLFVDQFEEVVTQSETEQGASFLKRLEETLEDPDSPVWVLATLRSEFLTPGLRHPAVARLFEEPLLLGPLDRARLPQVILGPARRVGLEFEVGLVERMVEETRGGDALPMLAFTLKCLHTAAGEARRVSAKTYEEIGGVEGTLRKRADAVLATATRTHSRNRVLEVLLKLVALNVESEPTRRRQSVEGLDDADLEILRLFADERLLTTDREGEVAYFEPAHEALLRAWPPLREAIRTRGDDLRFRADLERAAGDWQRAGRGESYLWFGERVRAAKQWLEKPPAEPLVAAFVEASAGRDRAVLARQANLLANRILNDYERNPERGLLLALAGAEEYVLTPRMRFALETCWRASRLRGRIRGEGLTCAALSADGKRVATADLGSLLRMRLSTRPVLDNPPPRCPVRILDASTGAVAFELDGHTEKVNALAFSADGSRLVSGSDDGSVRLWEPLAGTSPRVFQHPAPVVSVDLDPEGERVIAAAGDGAVWSWSIATGDGGLSKDLPPPPADSALGVSNSGDDVVVARQGQERLVLRGHEEEVLAIGVSADGEVLMTASRNEVLLWTLAEPPGPVTLRHGQGHSFRAVAFSRDGSRVMAASTVLQVWDVRKRELISETELSYTHGPAAFARNGARVATPSRIHLLEDPAQSVDIGPISRNAVALSADGTLFASAGYTWIEVLDAASGEERCLLGRHGDEEGDIYSDVAFSPDGSRLVSGSVAGGRCALWDARTGEKIHALEKGRSVAYSPDGTRVATAQGTSVFLWDATDGSLVAELSGHGGAARALAFSDDGALLAVATRAGNVRIWNVAAGDPIAELPGHALALAFSPCGALLAGTGGSGEIRLWDLLGEDELLARARSRVYRELTDTERAEYLAPAGLGD